MLSPLFRFTRHFILIGLSGAMPMAAQTAAPQGTIGKTAGQPGYRLSVTTRIVVLDVVVTDKHGNLVHRNDLTKNDFTIYEDKTPQTILSFETPAQHAMPASDKPIVNSAADLAKIGDAPVTVLVLDELNSTFQDMSFSRQMMVKYLQTQPVVLKEPTLLLCAEDTKFVQLHDYTQSRDELIEIVRKHMPELPSTLMNGGRSGPAAVQRMRQGLGALLQLAQASSGTPGRKNVIWVGNGFPTADLVGMEQTEADAITSAVRTVTAKLLAARITIYTINPIAGSSATVELDTPEDADTADALSGIHPFSNGTVNFTDLALSTGGMVFQGRNDLNNVIGEGIAHGDEYYTMSYSPTNKSDDPAKFRGIVVKMKDPNLRATTRNGYFQETAADMNPLADKSITEKQKQRDLVFDLSSALTTAIAYNGLTVSAAKASGGDFTIHVAEQNLMWSEPAADGSQHAEATVAAAWYDAKGKLLGHVAREETCPRGAANSGATFTLPLTDVPSYAVRTRFVVRDALSGRMGTVDIKK